MLFFTGGAFIVIRHTLKLVLEFQFDLQNPQNSQKWEFLKNGKFKFLAKIMAFFGPKVI